MQDAAIQRFEFVIEVYWKVLKKSFQYGLIDDEGLWLLMLDDRNSTSHMYKEEVALQVFNNLQDYLPVMEATYKKLAKRLETESS